MDKPVLTNVPSTFYFPTQGEKIRNVDRDYLLGRILGKGYFGCVFECYDEWGNELVAKVILPQNQTYEEVQDIWIRELRNLVTLRHPNVTFVYDAFEYKNSFYLIIERCASTIANLVNLQNYNGFIWFPYIARDILQAIEFIHAAGYVHKDIHPGNVFVSTTYDRMIPTNAPVFAFKVGDLGISRLESDINVFNTLLAQWMLPPEFLAPEDFGVVSRSVDIYHSALLLLGILLGEFPDFSQDQILNGYPRELAEKHGGCFAMALSRALRRHVSARTPSPLDFWRDILASLR